MYDALTPLFDRVTNADLRARLQVRAVRHARDSARAGARRSRAAASRVVRDRYGVPHIRATTRDGADLGRRLGRRRRTAGCCIQQARYNARVAAIDAPGLSRDHAARARCAPSSPARQTEDEVARQTRELRRAGPKGRRLLHDIDVYVDGINAQLRATESAQRAVDAQRRLRAQRAQGPVPRSGRRRRGAALGAARRAAGAAWAPRAASPSSTTCASATPPDHPPTIEGRFPYGRVPASRSGNVVVDPGSYQPVDLPPAAPRRAARAAAVAAAGLATSSSSTASARETGQPLFVGGPQIGYFYPGLTLEMELRGPGVDVARRDLGAVPRLHAHRPRAGLRLDADLGGRRHHRPVRRAALRRQRRQVPLQGPLPPRCSSSTPAS